MHPSSSPCATGIPPEWPAVPAACCPAVHQTWSPLHTHTPLQVFRPDGLLSLQRTPDFTDPSKTVDTYGSDWFEGAIARPGKVRAIGWWAVAGEAQVLSCRTCAESGSACPRDEPTYCHNLHTLADLQACLTSCVFASLRRCSRTSCARCRARCVTSVCTRAVGSTGLGLGVLPPHKSARHPAPSIANTSALPTLPPLRLKSAGPGLHLGAQPVHRAADGDRRQVVQRSAALRRAAPHHLPLRQVSGWGVLGCGLGLRSLQWVEF